MANYSILNIAYPFASVNSSIAGGAEQVLLSLDWAIVNRGYSSYVLARRGSVIRGSIIDGFEGSAGLDSSGCLHLQKEYKTLLEQFLEKNRVDLLHFHGIDFREYLPSVDIPVLVTLHLPISWYRAGSFDHFDNLYFNCVSRSQQLTCCDLRGLVPFIENGVSVPALPPRRKRAKFCLSLGRICPEKGFHIAIDASRRAKIPHILAGMVFPYKEHMDYYYSEIEPRLDGFRYRFIGQVGPLEKRRLLSSARCLLVPSMVPETSSLVAMESMACGTPVIAFRSGALCDIVEDGVNGYLVGSTEEMADAIERAERIDPEVCYSIAQKKYSVERMAGQYLELYERLAGSGKRYLLDSDNGEKLFRDCA